MTTPKHVNCTIKAMTDACEHGFPGPGCPECRKQRVAALVAKMEEDRAAGRVPQVAARAPTVPNPTGSRPAPVRASREPVRTPAPGASPCPICGGTMWQTRNGMEHDVNKCMLSGMHIGLESQIFKRWESGR